MQIVIKFDLANQDEVARVLAMIRERYPKLFGGEAILSPQDVLEDFVLAVLKGLKVGQFATSYPVQILVSRIRETKPNVLAAIEFLQELIATKASPDDLIAALIEIEPQLQRGPALEKFTNAFWTISQQSGAMATNGIGQACQELLSCLHIKNLVIGKSLRAFVALLIERGQPIGELADQLWQMTGDVESPNDLILKLRERYPDIKFDYEQDEFVDFLIVLIKIWKDYNFGDFAEKVSGFTGLDVGLKYNYPFKLIVRKTMAKLNIAEAKANLTEDNARAIADELKSQWEKLERPLLSEAVKQFLLYSYDLTTTVNGSFNKALSWLVSNMVRSFNTIS